MGTKIPGVFVCVCVGGGVEFGGEGKGVVQNGQTNSTLPFIRRYKGL